MKQLLWLLVTGSAAAQAQLPEDPTRPPAQIGESALTSQDVKQNNIGMPAVTAIFISPERRYAMVDGEVLYQGEQFRGMAVLEIRAGSVLFRHNDNDIEVALRQNKTLKKGKANGF